MGNSTSEILDRVNSQNLQQLLSYSKGDQDLIDMNEEVFDHGVVSRLEGLDKYDIPGTSSQKAPPPGKSAEQEVAMALSIIKESRFAEKHNDVKLTLQQDILANRSQDPASAQRLARLKALCAMHEAMLREEQRQMKVANLEDSVTGRNGELPNTAKLAIRWGAQTLLSCVECIGSYNPTIYGMIINQTTEILQSFKTNSLQCDDPSISEAIGMCTRFFSRVLNGEIREIPEPQQLKCISPLLGLATATGSLSSILSIATKFLLTPATSGFQPTAKVLVPILNSLYRSGRESLQGFQWSEGLKKDDIFIDDEGYRVSRNNADSNGSVLSLDIVESGQTYIEIVVTQNSSDSLYIGVTDANYYTFENAYDEKFVSFLCKFNGDVVNNKGETKGKAAALKQGDSLGIFIDMDDRKVTFYVNKEKQESEPFGPLPEKVRLCAALQGENQVLTIKRSPNYPESIAQQVIGQNNSLVTLADHQRFQCILSDDTESIDLKQVTPALSSAFIIACVEQLNEKLRQHLENERKFKCKRKNGLSLDVELTTIESLFQLLVQLKQHYNRGSFQVLDRELTVNSLISIIRVLRAHLLASRQFQSVQLPFELRQKLYDEIEQFMDACDDSQIGDELAQILSSCFEIFYIRPEEKLAYLIDSLKDINAGKEQSEIKTKLQNQVFAKLSQTEIIYSSFDLSNDTNFQKVSQFFELLIDLMQVNSIRAIQSDFDNTSLIKLMSTAQKCLLSQAAKTTFQGKCSELMFNYIRRVLQSSQVVLETFNVHFPGYKINQQNITQIKQTLLYSVLPNLLSALMITKLNLDSITTLMPDIQYFAQQISLLEGQAPKLVNGIGKTKLVYESDHNYPDNANLTHEVKVPNTKKYILTFDPQCKTENGCDYLILYEDSTQANQLCRWEGETWPKEPVVIEKPQLFFTFRSDGSVNYWGWKIDIEAYQEQQYFVRGWPDNLKEASRTLIASMSHMLISGDFEAEEEDEEIVKLLENPLLKFGVKDIAHRHVKEFTPLPSGLVGLAESSRQKLSVAGRLDDAASKLAVKENKEHITVQQYVGMYGTDGNQRFSDIEFINNFIHGQESILQAWGQLKQKSGVVGPSASTGGSELDQAERAIFSVYVAFFDMADTLSKIVEDPSIQISVTLKYIIKQSCSIRQWAQQFRQKSMDLKKEMTYAQIGNSIIQKCTFLLNSEYQIALNQLGYKNVMLNLVSTVVKAQGQGGNRMKLGSKWMAVQQAMKTTAQLRTLMDVKKKHASKTGFDPNKEFNEISDIVKQFLENPIPVEKLVEVMEKRRTKALARAIGFQSLGKLLSLAKGMETSLVRSFADSLRRKNGKVHYWDGLEGVDPNLLSCVKYCFFDVYELLQKDLVTSQKRELNWIYLHHYLALIEAMSYPFKESDTHMMIELKLSQGMKSLLRLAKGFIGTEIEQVEFDNSKVVTNLKLKKKGEQSEENSVLVMRLEEEEKEEEVEEENKSEHSQEIVQDELYVDITYGLDGACITDAQLVNEEDPEWKTISGPLEFNNQQWYIQVKRADPIQGNSYVTQVKEMFELTKEPYEKLLKPLNEAQLEAFNEVKLTLRKSSWKLFKLLLLGNAGSPSVLNESKQTQVQEMMMSVLDEQLQWNLQLKKPDDRGINLELTCSGLQWMDSKVEQYQNKKNPMAEWVRQFKAQTDDHEGEHLLKDLIDNFVKAVDPGMQGQISPEQMSLLDDDGQAFLEANAEIINEKGNFDFFKYLNLMKDTSSSFTPESIEFINNSYLFKELPKDIFEAEEEFNILEPINLINVAQKRYLSDESSESYKLFERLKNTETPGIDVAKDDEELPSSFKNSEGQIDLYLALNQIQKQPEELKSWHDELKDFLETYNELPPSIDFLKKKSQQPFDFLGSMLWAIFECCGSGCLNKVLSNPNRVSTLFKHMLMTGSEKTSLIASRILRRVIPTQHSPETIQKIWDQLDTSKFSHGVSEHSRKGMILTLFALIGIRKTWLYRGSVLKKLERWELEAHDFLRALANQERWRDEIVRIILQQLAQLNENLEMGQSPNDAGIGVVDFLGALLPDFNFDLMQNLPWTRVKMNDSTIEYGSIKQVNGDEVIVFSEDDDSTVTENKKKVQSVLLYLQTDLLDNFTQEEALNTINVMSNLISNLNSKSVNEVVDPRKKAGLLAIFRNVYSQLLNILSRLANRVENVPDYFIEEVLRPLIRNMPQVKDQYLSKVYTKCEGKISEKLAEIKDEDKKEEAEMTEQQAMELLGQMSEEDQVLAMEFASLEIKMPQIVQAFQAGIKDEESVRNFQGVQKQDVIKVFKLKKIDGSVLDQNDPTTEALILQNKKGHITIQSKSKEHDRISASQNLPEEVYSEVTQFPEEITVTAAISAEQNSEFGFTLGNFQVKFNENGNQSELSVGNQTFIIQRLPIYAFRLFITQLGEVQLSGDNFKQVVQTSDPFIFDGITIPKFGIFTSRGSKVTLQGMEIHIGRLIDVTQFWSEEDKEEAGGQFVKPHLRQTDPNKFRLQLTGAPDAVAREVLSYSTSLEEGVKHLVARNDSDTWDSKFKHQFEAPITDVKLINPGETVGPEWQIVPAYRNGETSQFDVKNRKLIAIKRHTTMGLPSQYISGITVAESKPEYQQLDNLTIDSNNDFNNNVYVIKGSQDQNAPVLRGLLFVIATSLNNVQVPIGYSLVQNKEFESVNIAPKGQKNFFVFLAYSASVSLLGCPITTLPQLVSTKKSQGNQGLVNDFQEKKGNNKKGYKLKEMSLLQLVHKLKDLKEAQIKQASQTLIVSLITKNSNMLTSLLESESLNKILLILKEQVQLLEQPINQAVDSNNYDLNMKFLQEIVFQLIINTYKLNGPSLREISKESKHPYDDNSNLEDVISIPGATKLRIEFDPQCKTESCDTLKFYAKPGKQEEIKSYCGEGTASWPPFEYEGDTLYTYFYSDGSVNYWGYKFKVIPVGSAKANDDPYADIQNPEAAVWLLEQFAQRQELGSGLEQLLSKGVLIPLFLFIHSNQDIQLTQRSLLIFKQLLRGQQSNEIRSMFSVLLEEAMELNEFQKKSNEYNPILQTVTLLLAEHVQRYNITLNEDWFNEFCNAYHDMDALTKKDKQLKAFIFERFLKKYDIIPKREVTISKHPGVTKVEQFEFEGAQSLKIQFQEETKVPKGQTVFISSDQAGKHSVEQKRLVKSVNATWAETPAGPSVERSNNNLTVTRTDSSGWGNALLSESFNSGVIRITFFIENDGDSSYLYIGVVATAEEYPMDSAIGSDCSHKLWSWKRSGEFHTNGEQSSRSEGNFGTGDTVILEINLDAKIMTCIKNDAPVYTFNNIEGDVRPVVSIGGENQLIVIKSVERLIGGSNSQLNRKQVIAHQSQVFVHYPVNEGYQEEFQWKTVPTNSHLLENQKDLIINGEQDSTRVHLSPGFNAGRHFVEFLFKETQTQQYTFFLLKDDNSVEESSIEIAQDDKIGLLADLWAGKFKIYKNGQTVSEFSVEFTQDFYNFAISISNQEEQQKLICLSEEPTIPAGIDMFTCPRPPVKQGTEEFDVKFTLKFVVEPIYPGRTKEIIEYLSKFMTEEQKNNWNNEYQSKFISYFKSGAAEELVQFLDDLCRNQGYSVMELTEEQLNPQEKDLIYFKALERLSIEDIRELYEILKIFNKNVNNVLRLLDLHIESRNKMTMIQKSFVGSRSFIFNELKKSQFDSAIQRTNNDIRPSILIDRPKAARHKQRGAVDLHAQFSIFGQIFRLINSKQNNELRNSERIYQVDYRGEGSTDAGGPYNESITNMMDELQSSFIRLLIPSPNQTYNIGDYRGSWIPNPQANTKLEYELFTFLGKLFGVAIRTQNNLNLSFPPLFWKRLMLEEVNVMDLKAFDETVYQILNIMRNLEGNGITPETFGMAFDERFTTTDSSGATIELVPGGSEIVVTFENAKQYADLIEQARLNECTQVYECLRKGMSAVIPLDLLNLFSWKQVETLVIGAPDINIDILMENTDYDGCSESDRHIKFFWEVLREFSPKERSLFLKFVWGRSKLPAGKNFRHMKITRYNPGANVDNYMPVSHTCFFTIDLPPYTNKNSMHEKLLYAITHCTAIDLDHGAGAGWEEEED